MFASAFSIGVPVKPMTRPIIGATRDVSLLLNDRRLAIVRPVPNTDGDTRSPLMPATQLATTDAAYLSSWLSMSKADLPGTSNQPSHSMPFQRWFKFKEAYAPSFVVDIIKSLPYKPKTCLDPFGGSGTTALCCQFLGITPTTIEVNPFMADLIEAKLTKYDLVKLRLAFRTVSRRAKRKYNELSHEDLLSNAPPTFIEPGINDRWIFSAHTAKCIFALRNEIDLIEDIKISRLLRVLLGCHLVENSNVVVNGKGRRYRSGWKLRPVSIDAIFAAFDQACSDAISDLAAFQNRPVTTYHLLRGDARKVANQCGSVDFIMTSPPYPNSFDYTDIYNVELWTLGYLNSSEDNLSLRRKTLRSHVQIADYGKVSALQSRKLNKTYKDLAENREGLWSNRIPEMICHYFQDMKLVLTECKKALALGGKMVLTVGNSRYAGILVDVPGILSEIAPSLGFSVDKTDAVRSMRSSAQQGGNKDLAESLVWLSHNG